MKTNVLISLLIAVISQICFGQDFNKAKLDNYFDSLDAHNKFFGNVAVSQNGEVIFQRYLGFSDVENNIKAGENSKYRIGSVTKTFTAVLVLKAIEENKLNLNQTIDKYFPTIQNASKITIKHLLSHRSGIHDFTNDQDYLTWYTQSKTENEMVEIITKAGSDFEPGSNSAYCNSGFILLTFILENVYEKSYDDLLKKYIAQPIGLINTYLGKKIDPDNNECKSYRYTGNWIIQPETDISIALGAGGIVSTSEDLIKFSDALLNGKIIKKEYLDLMEPINEYMGIGLFQMPFLDKIGYGHNGEIDGFYAQFAYYKNGNFSVALTSNGTNYSNYKIFNTLISACYEQPIELLEFKTFKVSSEDLDKYLGVWTSTQSDVSLTVTKENNILFAQGKGQPFPYALDAIEKDKFTLDQFEIELDFNPTENTMILIQGKAQIKYSRK